LVKLHKLAYSTSAGANTSMESGTVQIRFKCFKLGIVAHAPAFQWSTSEQVYPFEKASDGSTLYCKEITAGALSSGYTGTAHGISGLTIDKVFSSDIVLYDQANGAMPNGQAHPGDARYSSFVSITPTDISVVVGSLLNISSMKARIIYSK
jgi:hypothetical protein